MAQEIDAPQLNHSLEHALGPYQGQDFHLDIVLNDNGYLYYGNYGPSRGNGQSVYSPQLIDAAKKAKLPGHAPHYFVSCVGNDATGYFECTTFQTPTAFNLLSGFLAVLVVAFIIYSACILSVDKLISKHHKPPTHHHEKQGAYHGKIV